MIHATVFQTALTGATRNRGLFVVRGHPLTPSAKDTFAFTHLEFLHPDGIESQPARCGDPTHWEYAEKNYKSPDTDFVVQKPIPKSFSPEDPNDSDREDPVAPLVGTQFATTPFSHQNVTFSFRRATVAT